VVEEGVSCRGRHSKSIEDTKVLMASYVEDNTSQSKGWIFDSGSTVHVYSRSTPWLQRRKGLSSGG